MNLETANESIGNIVHVTDGTPRPPERFTKKVDAWESKNYSGSLADISDYGDEGAYAAVCVKKLSHVTMNRSGTPIANIIEGEHPLATAHASVL
mgnify:CR=1 FL=1